MLACLHYGRELSPRAVACPQCGEPGPAAPPAWTAGPAAPAENPGLEGAGLARAGIVVGWVGVGVAMILLGITAFGMISSSGDLPVRFKF